MKKYLSAIVLLLFLLSCNLGSISPEAQATQTSTALTAIAASWTETPTSTATFTPTFTLTPTETLTPTLTFTPTITLSPTVTATPTFDFPSVTVNKQAHCRYGPSVAYLHAADLYAGEKGTVRGRFIYSQWLYIKFDKLNYFCWVAPSVVDVVGDISKINYTELHLQSIGTNQYGPPNGVTAVRNGGKVTISWNQVKMTTDKDRGYLLELFVCQNGYLLWWTDSYPDQFTTSYTVQDEKGCSEPSSGLLYTVEKHGFSEPAVIPWPAP
jgi:hypothetical protein